jgi:phosphoribosyl 1,2-cyclic phosphodiesterase
MIHPAAESDCKLHLRCWGVRGSIPAPGPGFVEFGGDTACLEVRGPAGEPLIFDGGSGLRKLGNAMAKARPAGGRSIPFFLTHFHWDHIQGIPYFQPLFEKTNNVTFFSMHREEETRRALDVQMSTPYFPFDFEALPAARQFVHMGPEAVECHGVRVKSFPMNHPQGAIGYRIEHGGASIVYASDLEHGDRELDRVLRDNAQGADVLIYDAQYTPEEYEAKRGWGHSTWLEGTRVARDAGVKRLILIHHDPERTDSQNHQIVNQARAEFEHTEAASVGLTLCL